MGFGSASTSETLTKIIEQYVAPKVGVYMPLDRDGYYCQIRWGDYYGTTDMTDLVREAVKAGKLTMSKELKPVIDNLIHGLARSIVDGRA